MTEISTLDSFHNFLFILALVGLVVFVALYFVDAGYGKRARKVFLVYLLLQHAHAAGRIDAEGKRLGNASGNNHSRRGHKGYQQRLNGKAENAKREDTVGAHLIGNGGKYPQQEKLDARHKERRKTDVERTAALFGNNRFRWKAR